MANLDFGAIIGITIAGAIIMAVCGLLAMAGINKWFDDDVAPKPVEVQMHDVEGRGAYTPRGAATPAPSVTAQVVVTADATAERM